MADENETKSHPETVIEVTSFRVGSFKRGGKDVSYVELAGRDVADETFRRALAFGGVGGALENEMATLWDGKEDLASRGLVIKLTGETKQPQDEKKPPYISLAQFGFISGPQADLVKLRKSGGRALKAAGLALEGGNLKDAYRSLEEFVARITGMPAPSIDGTFDFEGVDDDMVGPEEVALERLQERDARDGVEHQPAPVSSTAAEVVAAAEMADDASDAPETTVDAVASEPVAEPAIEATEPVLPVAAPVGRPVRPAGAPRSAQPAQAAPASQVSDATASAAPAPTRPPARPSMRARLAPVADAPGMTR